MIVKFDCGSAVTQIEEVLETYQPISSILALLQFGWQATTQILPCSYELLTRHCAGTGLGRTPSVANW